MQTRNLRSAATAGQGLRLALRSTPSTATVLVSPANAANAPSGASARPVRAMRRKALRSSSCLQPRPSLAVSSSRAEADRRTHYLGTLGDGTIRTALRFHPRGRTTEERSAESRERCREIVGRHGRHPCGTLPVVKTAERSGIAPTSSGNLLTGYAVAPEQLTGLAFARVHTPQECKGSVRRLPTHRTPQQGVAAEHSGMGLDESTLPG